MMDSGNSGSSSGGDEGYDSRASAAFNPPPPYPFPNHLQMPNFNVPWPGTRSDTNPTTHIFVQQQLPPAAARGAENTNFSNESRNQASAAARNPKKRSRASRRAPTTVLNTDTSNFRAMVQQFTGVPAPPFHDINNNINKRSRLHDLFGTTTSDGSAYPPPYLLRPFAQKPTPPPLASSSVNSNSLLSTINTEEARKFSSNLFDIQNPIVMNSLVFQNNPSFPISNDHQRGSSFSNMMIPSSNEQVHYYNSFAKMGGLSDQFGLISHGNDYVTVSGLPNLTPSERKDDQKERS